MQKICINFNILYICIGDDRLCYRKDRIWPSCAVTIDFDRKKFSPEESYVDLISTQIFNTHTYINTTMADTDSMPK